MKLCLVIVITYLVSVATGIPCSPCEQDSDCLPYLEYCNLPNELFNFPSTSFEDFNSHQNNFNEKHRNKNRNKGKGRYDTPEDK